MKDFNGKIIRNGDQVKEEWKKITLSVFPVDSCRELTF